MKYIHQHHPPLIGEGGRNSLSKFTGRIPHSARSSVEVSICCTRPTYSARNQHTLQKGCMTVRARLTVRGSILFLLGSSGGSHQAETHVEQWQVHDLQTMVERQRKHRNRWTRRWELEDDERVMMILEEVTKFCMITLQMNFWGATSHVAGEGIPGNSTQRTPQWVAKQDVMNGP